MAPKKTELGSPAASPVVAAPPAAAKPARVARPEDTIYATDYIAPTLVACAHAFWIYSKYVSMLAGNVDDARVATGALALPWWEPLVMVSGYLVFIGGLWLYMEAMPTSRCR